MTDFLEILLRYDEQIFQLINGEGHNAFLDAIVPIWRNKYFWAPLYVFIISFVLLNYKRKGLFLIGALLMTMTISDTCSSQIIKKSVQRLRPCNDIALKSTVKLLVPCGGGYSFTSSHATNHFALASFLFLTLGLHFRWIRWPLILWALSIALGQVYVGVHYPLDILMGSLLGILIGNIVVRIYRKIEVWQIDYI